MLPAPLFQQIIPRAGRHAPHRAGRRPDLEERQRRVVEQAVALGRTQDVGGQATRDDRFVYESPVGAQPLLFARLVTEDEQEQVLSAVGAGMDRRRDALRRAER